MGLVVRELLAELHDSMLAFRHHEAREGALAGRLGQAPQIWIEMAWLATSLLLDLQSKIDD